MATAYTLPIEEDPSFSVEQFVMRCLRAMGCCVHQRDEDLSVPPRAERQDTSVLEKRVRMAEENLRAFRQEPEQELDKAYNEYVEQMTQTIERMEQRYRVLSRRYDYFIHAIESWDAPEEMKGFRGFMLQQLQESAPHEPNLSIASFQEWRESKEHHLARMVEHAKQQVEDAKNDDGAAFIRAVLEEWLVLDADGDVGPGMRSLSDSWSSEWEDDE